MAAQASNKMILIFEYSRIFTANKKATNMNVVNHADPVKIKSTEGVCCLTVTVCTQQTES